MITLRPRLPEHTGEGKQPPPDPNHQWGVASAQTNPAARVVHLPLIFLISTDHPL